MLQHFAQPEMLKKALGNANNSTMYTVINLMITLLLWIYVC